MTVDISGIIPGASTTGRAKLGGDGAQEAVRVAHVLRQCLLPAAPVESVFIVNPPYITVNHRHDCCCHRNLLHCAHWHFQTSC